MSSATEFRGLIKAQIKMIEEFKEQPQLFESRVMVMGGGLPKIPSLSVSILARLFGRALQYNYKVMIQEKKLLQVRESYSELHPTSETSNSKKIFPYSSGKCERANIPHIYRSFRYAHVK